MAASGVAGALREEHVLLGASFGEPAAGDVPPVTSYAGEGELEGLLSGAVLADLTGTAYLLVSGEDAPGLFCAAACGRELAVGEAAFEAVLTGEGRLLSVPLALRTGDHEYVLLDPTHRGAALATWLGFVRGARGGDGRTPFAAADVEDASGMLVPLMLAGARSGEVLSDYVRTPGEALPGEGAVAAVHLDAIPALVARVPGAGPQTWLALVPAARARAVWRSLLSFTEVAPVGTRAAGDVLSGGRPWSRALPEDGPLDVPRAELAAWGLMREGDDFVGARLLGR